MLIDISVSNFRSIKDKQTLSLIPASSVKELEENLFHVNKATSLLRSAVVYGRNASGKSNFLKAFYALGYLVNKSSEFKIEKEIAPYEPFKLEENNLTKPVEIEINFFGKDNIRYHYFVSYDEKEIISEKLSFYPKKQSAKLFHREKGKSIDFGDALTGKKKDIESLTLPNQLFLSKAGMEKNDQLSVPYLFFAENMFTSIFHDTIYDDVLIRHFSEKYMKHSSPSFKENINKLLFAADTGILGVDVKELSEDTFILPESIGEEEKKKIVEKYKYQVHTRHKFFKNGKEKGETLFRLKEESTGTIKLIALGGLIIDALENGEVLIVDELDKSLHPHLTRALIKIFNNPKTNPKNAQLIVATHDATLLTASLFRRDQIWIVDKEYEGSTTLTCISDMQGVRANVPFEKWYLSGKFGGTPVINEYELDFNL